MKVAVRSLSGQPVGEVELQEAVFGVAMNWPVVHQALVQHLANARLGTAQTKTRGEVAGSTRKLFRQKGTGHARQGSLRAPHRKGSGAAFGPHPRSYAQAMPKKMRRLAIRCVLSAKVAEGNLVVVEGLGLAEPKAKRWLELQGALGIKGGVLVAPQSVDDNLVLATRNLPKVKTLGARFVNVRDLLSSDVLLTNVDGVRQMEALWSPRPRSAAAPVEG